ncbi:unnamed protein product [Meganyctiphanes norvegica]|uniref:Uncharacterized protein n=1 Tax=Meganyctiphanes norvegica TaxID=48144 RepID=A0AAV2R3S7_MEGNR
MYRLWMFRRSCTLVILFLNALLFTGYLKRSSAGLSDAVMKFMRKGAFYSTASEINNYKCNLTLLMERCDCSRQFAINSDQPCGDVTIKHNGNVKSNTLHGSITGHQKDHQRISTCSTTATMRGPRQQVVAYSLFGKFPNEYSDAIHLQAESIKELYPGWVMRVYHDLDLTLETMQRWMCDLECRYPHLDFCDINNLPVLGDISSTAGSSWRVAVMGDLLVHQYAVRDLDSPIFQREADAVQEWIESKQCYHLMHDNHAHRAPVLAGLWGGCSWWRPDEAMSMRNEMLNATRLFHEDQRALADILWPEIQENVLMHDSYHCMRYPESRPFPSQRFNLTYVGQRTYRAKYITDRIVRECPYKCRPLQHQDWLYC